RNSVGIPEFPPFPGVTVCQLCLGGAGAGVGNSLLLTRLEKDSEPVSVRIPTERSQAPLSWVFRELARIQREQLEANGCRERREWWERRSRLDRSMEALIRALDSQLLGCWRGLLLPRGAGNFPLEFREWRRLLRELRGCGWERP
ncbi:ESPL1 protein, partial [Dasyornis broadbenti]|nr:ESPL1 protein [Dasyornis broadbenti]